MLLSVDANSVDDADALDYRIATLSVGGTSKLTYWRKGSVQSVSLDLVAPPERPAPRYQQTRWPTTRSTGRRFANMSPALAEELGTGRFRPGVIILQLRSGSTAARLGFRPGDTVLEVNGQKVATVAVLKTRLDGPASRWQIGIKRGGKSLNLVIGG